MFPPPGNPNPRFNLSLTLTPGSEQLQPNCTVKINGGTGVFTKMPLFGRNEAETNNPTITPT